MSDSLEHSDNSDNMELDNIAETYDPALESAINRMFPSTDGGASPPAEEEVEIIDSKTTPRAKPSKTRPVITIDPKTLFDMLTTFASGSGSAPAPAADSTAKPPANQAHAAAPKSAMKKGVKYAEGTKQTDGSTGYASDESSEAEDCGTITTRVVNKEDSYKILDRGIVKLYHYDRNGTKKSVILSKEQSVAFLNGKCPVSYASTKKGMCGQPRLLRGDTLDNMCFKHKGSRGFNMCVEAANRSTSTSSLRSKLETQNKKANRDKKTALTELRGLLLDFSNFGTPSEVKKEILDEYMVKYDIDEETLEQWTKDVKYQQTDRLKQRMDKFK